MLKRFASELYSEIPSFDTRVLYIVPQPIIDLVNPSSTKDLVVSLRSLQCKQYLSLGQLGLCWRN